MAAETISAPAQQHLQIQTLIRGTMEAIRSHPRVGRGVPVIVAVEACSAEATWIAPVFERYEDTLVMREFHNEGCFGVPKNRNVLIGMIGTTQEMLARKLVSFPADAVSHATQYTKTSRTMRDHREMLAKQFGSFKLNQHTGKIDGKSGGANDDQLITFMMSLYWMTRFCVRNDPFYMDFRRRYPAETWMSAMTAYLANYN